MPNAFEPLPEFAFGDWIRCDAYLGTMPLTDSVCRSQTDLAQLAADLYRQHILRGNTGSRRREVLVRVTPETIRVRVLAYTSGDDARSGSGGEGACGGGHVEFDREFAVSNIARCTSGHDPFPQVVVIVDCLGVRPFAGQGVNRAVNPSMASWTMDMCCHGIACINAAEACQLAKTLNMAFQEHLRLRAPHHRPFPGPGSHATNRQIGRSTISTIATPIEYNIIEPPAYMPAERAPVAPLGNMKKKSPRGLPEVF